jgi:hypothetical protein
MIPGSSLGRVPITDWADSAVSYYVQNAYNRCDTPSRETIIRSPPVRRDLNRDQDSEGLDSNHHTFIHSYQKGLELKECSRGGRESSLLGMGGEMRNYKMRCGYVSTYFSSSGSPAFGWTPTRGDGDIDRAAEVGRWRRQSTHSPFSL